MKERTKARIVFLVIIGGILFAIMDLWFELFPLKSYLQIMGTLILVMLMMIFLFSNEDVKKEEVSI